MNAPSKKLAAILFLVILFLPQELKIAHAENAEVSTTLPFQLNTTRLEQLSNYAASLKQLRSLIIIQHGQVLLEKYFNGATPNTAVNIKSAAKSVLSALVGIAIDKGQIKNIDEEIFTSIGEYFPSESIPFKQKITILHLLTMTSGLKSASRTSYTDWHNSSNWIKKALSMEMISEPGKKYVYSTSDAHLLSATLSKILKMDLFEFAKTRLFKPAEMEVQKWEKDPQGFYFGGNDIYMRPRDLAKFGLLYLNKGKRGKRQIIPKKWIDESTSNHVVPDLWSPFPIRGYGYLWWLLKVADYNAIAAWGHGGQYLLIFPEIDAVIVIASDAEARYSKQYYHSLAKLVTKYIF